MGDAALKLTPESKIDLSIESSSNIIEETYTEEIILGICGQLGTDLEFISKIITDIVTEEYAYECQEIKMSDYIFDYAKIPKPKYLLDRIIMGMDWGDKLRSTYSNNVLADYAITSIYESRMRDTSSDDIDNEKFSSRRRCFIINSIKHPDEFALLKKVYGESFYMLGVFSPLKIRTAYLEKAFHKKDHPLINSLINRDTAEDIQEGQKVEDVFIHSDYFVQIDNSGKNIHENINKFIDLIFDFGINTPTIEERAMYQATSAAANSACLSRQVGACITDANGAILSVGWNDVPAPGGGVYNTGSLNDSRCFIRRACANSVRKNYICEGVLEELLTNKYIDISNKDSVKEILEKKGLKDLIEFARSIHAEMHAIILGSQNTGNKMVNGKLFCTTYPCHNCARHIVMAGIKDVYYIEPYRKSLSLTLHDDAITEDVSDRENKVLFQIFEGVAPKSFMKFYRLNSDNRKIKINKQQKNLLSPKYRISLRALNQLESISFKYLTSNNLTPHEK